MTITYQMRGDTLWVQLDGELDHHSADQVRSTMEDILNANSGIRQLRMNLSQLSFMDSAGIGVLLGRYNQIHARRGVMTIYGMKPSVKKIVDMAGLAKIMCIE